MRKKRNNLDMGMAKTKRREAKGLMILTLLPIIRESLSFSIRSPSCRCLLTSTSSCIISWTDTISMRQNLFQTVRVLGGEDSSQKKDEKSNNLRISKRRRKYKTKYLHKHTSYSSKQENSTYLLLTLMKNPLFY